MEGVCNVRDMSSGGVVCSICRHTGLYTDMFVFACHRVPQTVLLNEWAELRRWNPVSIPCASFIDGRVITGPEYKPTYSQDCLK